MIEAPLAGGVRRATITSTHTLVLLLALVLAFCAVRFGSVRYTHSDPLGSLLVSESILRRGTVKLDAYGAERLEGYGYRVRETEGHFYYYFPIGTSLFSVPVVAVAGLFGYEMTRNDPQLQIIIASILSAMSLLLLYATARIFLPRRASLLCSTCFLFATSVMSTNGTALWSHDFALVFSMAAIYLLMKASTGDSGIRWPQIGVLLFSAYLCRPTAALLIPLALIFYFRFDRGAAIKSAGVTAGLLLVFVGFSYAEFGQLLPDYYLPQRLAGGDFGTALVGNLFSPARGLVVFSPFIFIAALGSFAVVRDWPVGRDWLLLGLVWPLLHLLLISGFPHWWGGWSYGPRLMTDVLPGLFLLTVRGWPRGLRSAGQVLQASVLALAVLFSLFAHTYKGLFDPHGLEWNASPNVDHHPEYLFDWRYPQFLYDEAMHERRAETHRIEHPSAAVPLL